MSKWVWQLVAFRDGGAAWWTLQRPGLADPEFVFLYDFARRVRAGDVVRYYPIS